MNLDALSLRELQDLQKKVSKAIETYHDRAKKEAIAELNDKARALGFTIEELFGDKPAKATRAPVAAKYRHPENAEVTWSGQGRKPTWFVAALDGGASESDLLIK